MRELHNINPYPFQAKISRSKRVITWRVGNRTGQELVHNTKQSAIAAQIRDIAVRFNTLEIVL